MDVEQENQYSEYFIQKQSNYRGSAKINLQHLTFVDTNFLDPKNVTRLKKIFGLEGCLRLDLEHRIPALISEDVLLRSLNTSRVDRRDLFTNEIPRELRFPEGFTLECLHGKHRIAAGQEFLNPYDKWWVVDFYSDGLSQHLQKDLREEYANSRNFCDGDIYRQIRHCQNGQDAVGEGRWYARLSEGKRKDVKQLLNRSDLRSLREALDNLLPYMGFWPSLQIGTFHRVLGLKCPDEVQHYLNHIRLYWDKVVEDNQDLRPLIDFQSIQLLQTRNPWASIEDNEFITDLMHRQILFPMITDELRRARILRYLQQSECMIPSLHTCFEDTKWLEPCAKILRDLLPAGCRKSTRQALYRDFHAGPNGGTVRVQSRDLNLIEREASRQEAVETAYRQLWLYAWRHFPELSSMLPLKDVGKPKPRATASNERCWQELAQLADSLGFHSQRIDYLRNQNSDHRMTIEFLHQVRPKEFYPMSDDVRTHQAVAICQLLNSIERPTRYILEDVPIAVDSMIPVEYRCGRPHEQSFKDSKPRFFFSDVYANKIRALSNFSINRDIFQAFFGLRSPLEAVADTPPVGPQAPPMEPTGSSPQPAPPTEPQHEHPPSNGPEPPPVELSPPPAPPPEPQQDQRPSDRPPPPSVEGPELDVPVEPQYEHPPSSIPQAPAVEPVDSTSQPTAPEPQLSPSDRPQPLPVQPTPSIPQPAESTEPRPQETQPDLKWYHIVQWEGPRRQPVLRTDRDPYDTEQSNLYNYWRNRCDFGDLFVVDISGNIWLHWPRGGESIRGIPEPLLGLANNSYFAIYHPYRESLRCIRLDSVMRFVRNPEYDGVIYVFQHCKESSLDEHDREKMRDESFTSVKGGTTKTRLYQVERKCCRKRPSETQARPGHNRDKIARRGSYTFEEEEL